MLLSTICRTHFQNLAAVCILATLSFISPHVFAGQASIVGGGAKIDIDFNNPQNGKVLFVGSVPSIQGLVFNGLTVNLNLNGFQRNFTLDSKGQGLSGPDLFQANDDGKSIIFSLNALDNNLLVTYENFFSNETVSKKAVSFDASITFGSSPFTATLDGEFDAVMNKTGTAFLGIIKAPKNPAKPVVKITTLTANPNPAKVGNTVTIKGSVNLSQLKGPVNGNINFGDMSDPVHVSGDDLRKMLKTGVPHVYASAGVFVARISFVGSEAVAATRLFILVGPGYDVNSTNGAYTHLSKTGNGGVTLELGIDNVRDQRMPRPRSSTTPASARDGGGGEAIKPRQVITTMMGTNINVNFTTPGIYFTETNVLDAASNTMGIVRKTIVIGDSDINSSVATVRSAADADDDDFEVEPREVGDETDNVISFTSMSGSFKFTTSNFDKVAFTGKVGLPAGYTPKNVAGNDIHIGMGNVGDIIHLDAKGKLILPTQNGVITRFKLIPPKLINGVAIGGEMARVNITMNFGDLDVIGYDSEGVTVNVRSDEEGQSSVARFIQVDMLISGKTYSVLAPVNYKVSANGGFGQMSGRSSR